MKDKSVIFDTNAYRNLTIDTSLESCIETFVQLRNNEQARNIDVYISPIVLLELFAHLTKLDDPSYSNCKNAASMAYFHSKLENGKEYRLLADGDSLLAKVMFGYEIPGIKEKWSAIGGYAYQIYTNPEEENLDSFREGFRSIATFVDFVEKRFIEDYYRFVVQGTNPNATDWSGIKNDPIIRKKFLDLLNSEKSLIDIAKAQVVKACTIAQVDPTTLNDIDKRANEVLKIFPAPIYLYREIMKRIAISGCDLSNTKKKRWNWIWDILILYSCANSTVNGKLVLLVTSDNDMLEAAKSAGLTDKVMSLNEYLEEINNGL